MSTQKSLSLACRFELSHPSFSNPGRLMGLLCSIILALLSAVDRVAVASVFSFQSTGVYETKLDTPETNRLSADSDSSFGN